MRFAIMASASAAVLMFAGSAFAQGATTTTYIPAVTQTSGNNASSIDQIGNGNGATVTQSGGTSSDGNGSVILQGGTGFAGPANNNQAAVTETGVGDRALVMQANSLSTTGNPVSGTPSGNTATVTQGGTNQGAFAYQFGSGNRATIQQQGTASTHLPGNANAQGVAGAPDSQTGINAAVAQRHTGFSAMETAVFGGIDPAQNTEQVNVVQDWAVNNLATATQTASANNSRTNITQAYQVNSTATTSEAGYDQDAWISQENILTNPVSNNNTASITQSLAAPLASAAIAQFDATNSYSTITQNGLSGATGPYAVAYSYQTGAGEYSTITQSDDSTATVVQTGGSDVSNVTQMGPSSNTATVNQGLANGWSHVAQNGSGNTASVTQGATAPFLAPR